MTTPRCETCPLSDGPGVCPGSHFLAAGHAAPLVCARARDNPHVRRQLVEQATGIDPGLPAAGADAGGPMPPGVEVSAGGDYRAVQALDLKVAACPDRTVIEQTRCGCYAKCARGVNGGVVRTEHCRACVSA